MEYFWTKVKSELKGKIPGHCYRMWVEPVTLFKEDKKELILACPNSFSRKRLSDQYKGLIEDEIKKLSGNNRVVRIVVSDSKSSPEAVTVEPMQLCLPNLNNKPHSGRMLRKDFTFDQFVVGNNNQFAYSAALSLAAKKQTDQNSLFLLSKTGMGKSHLSQAVGHHIFSESPAERVYYITAEDFTNEMVGAYKSNTIGDFKEKYRQNCDVLLLEDVQYLSGKNGTQEELANTLDFLMCANKKIIYSSCYLPSDIPKLSDKLKSRLSGGLISNIESPDYKTRVKILKAKADTNNYKISDEVLQYLAGELVDDVRQLKSGLVGVAAKASLTGNPADLRLAESIVKNIARRKETITITGIKKLICKYYNVTVQDLISKSRRQSIVKPRQVAMYLSRKYTDQSLQAIGKSFNRYHATALHAMKTVEKGVKENGSMQKHVEFLSQKLEAGAPR